MRLANSLLLSQRRTYSIVGRKVEWKRGNATVPGLLFGKSARAAVIVLQEWWGLTDEIKAQASFIAERGDMCTLVPDLYRGKVGVDAEEASHLMGALDWPNAVKDIGAAVEYLKHECHVKKVGITGFCMGGALTLAASVLCKNFTCAVPFYGVCAKELADISTITIPVQGHFGALDDLSGFSDAAARRDLESKLSQAGIDYEIFTYPNVGHAFMNNSEDSIQRKRALGQINNKSGAIHDPAAIRLAYDRLFAFFEKHLGH